MYCSTSAPQLRVNTVLHIPFFEWAPERLNLHSFLFFFLLVTYKVQDYSRNRNRKLDFEQLSTKIRIFVIKCRIFSFENFQTFYRVKNEG